MSNRFASELLERRHPYEVRRFATLDQILDSQQMSWTVYWMYILFDKNISIQKNFIKKGIRIVRKLLAVDEWLVWNWKRLEFVIARIIQMNRVHELQLRRSNEEKIQKSNRNTKD